MALSDYSEDELSTYVSIINELATMLRVVSATSSDEDAEVVLARITDNLERMSPRGLVGFSIASLALLTKSQERLLEAQQELLGRAVRPSHN